MDKGTLVMKASAAVKWILPEDGREEAPRLQETYQDDEIDLIAPSTSNGDPNEEFSRNSEFAEMLPDPTLV